MAITAQQKEERKRFIGSSDAAAVLGLDPYRTPLDVFYDKTGRIEATGLPANNDAIDIGVELEGAILDWFAKKNKLVIRKNDRFVHENGIMAANFDALEAAPNPEFALEAKTHGVVSLYISEQWGEVETEEVPDRVKLQCMHQMAVLPSINMVYVPVLLGGVGLRSYYVERDEKLIDDMTNIMLSFWNDHVLKNVPPEEGTLSFETAKKLKRVPNKTISLSDRVVSDWLVAKEYLKAAEATKKEKELLLLSALGDAEGGECSQGTITYLMGKPRAAYTVQEHPGYRTLRLSTKKEK